jgi:hypothetical protein
MWGERYATTLELVLNVPFIYYLGSATRNIQLTRNPRDSSMPELLNFAARR